MPKLLSLLLLICSAPVFSQVAVKASANFPETRWSGADTPAEEVFDWGIGNELAVGYWFRLKNKRVEFLPSIYYATASDGDLDLQELGAEFNVNIYPFDFGGDCDCPTFGKQGPQLEKGFFIQLTPGYARYQLESPVADFESGGGFTFGAGVGMDIGVTNFLTISPIASVRSGTASFGGDLGITDINGQPLGTTSPKLTTLQLGLRALFRFDHKRY